MSGQLDGEWSRVTKVHMLKWMYEQNARQRYMSTSTLLPSPTSATISLVSISMIDDFYDVHALRPPPDHGITLTALAFMFMVYGAAVFATFRLRQWTGRTDVVAAILLLFGISLRLALQMHPTHLIIFMYKSLMVCIVSRPVETLIFVGALAAAPGLFSHNDHPLKLGVTFAFFFTLGFVSTLYPSLLAAPIAPLEPSPILPSPRHHETSLSNTRMVSDVGSWETLEGKSTTANWASCHGRAQSLPIPSSTGSTGVVPNVRAPRAQSIPALSSYFDEPMDTDPTDSADIYEAYIQPTPRRGGMLKALADLISSPATFHLNQAFGVVWILNLKSATVKKPSNSYALFRQNLVLTDGWVVKGADCGRYTQPRLLARLWKYLPSTERDRWDAAYEQLTADYPFAKNSAESRRRRAEAVTLKRERARAATRPPEEPWVVERRVFIVQIWIAGYRGDSFIDTFVKWDQANSVHEYWSAKDLKAAGARSERCVLVNAGMMQLYWDSRVVLQPSANPVSSTWVDTTTATATNLSVHANTSGVPLDIHPLHDVNNALDSQLACTIRDSANGVPHLLPYVDPFEVVPLNASIYPDLLELLASDGTVPVALGPTGFDASKFEADTTQLAAALLAYL
ncbi:hypothetical protein BKA62DRAFT_765660 [Auriculariales sp. MPI-PUGE-AT-0066]|nr:hypothetical protein BKA62DRAFT_765660 [Auriculariales sp. MPI-PUGE-AT-0066]